MKQRKGVYSWDNEPAAERRSGFKSTLESDWQQSTQSTFNDPSRLEPQRRVHRQQHGKARWLLLSIAVLGLTLVATLVALWPALSKHLNR